MFAACLLNSETVKASTPESTRPSRIVTSPYCLISVPGSLEPESSTTKPPRHHKTAKGKSFLGTPQGKTCPALLVHPFPLTRNIIQRFCGVLAPRW